MTSIPTPTLNRRSTIARLASIGLMPMALADTALADAPYPSKIIKLIVPTAPGGSVDAVGRRLADSLNSRLGTTIVIDNKAGAGGSIGVDAAAKSPPDGYTLVLGIAATLTVQPAVRANLPYNASTDLAPIAIFAQGGLVLAVPADSPVKTVQDLKALAAKNGDLSFGTGGQATFGHLTGEVIGSALGFPMRHIPYRGAAPAVADLAGGLLDVAVVDALSVAPHVQSKKLRVIAIAGPTRHPTFPNVPTLTESGVPFARGTWIGLFAPSATPAPILAKLSSAIRALSGDAAFRADLTKMGFIPVFIGAQEASKILAEEIAAWKTDAQRAKIKLD